MKKEFFKNTGNWLIIGFISAALGMLFLAYKATTVKYEMAAEGDYYQLETKFNDLLNAKRNGLKLGNDFRFEEDGDKLMLFLPSYLSGGLENGHIEFYCVSNSKFDTSQVLHKNEKGVYRFSRSEVAQGKNYVVKVSFKSQETEYYKEFKIQ